MPSPIAGNGDRILAILGAVLFFSANKVQIPGVDQDAWFQRPCLLRTKAR